MLREISEFEKDRNKLLNKIKVYFKEDHPVDEKWNVFCKIHRQLDFIDYFDETLFYGFDDPFDVFNKIFGYVLHENIDFLSFKKMDELIDSGKIDLNVSIKSKNKWKNFIFLNFKMGAITKVC